MRNNNEMLLAIFNMIDEKITEKFNETFDKNFDEKFDGSFDEKFDGSFDEKFEKKLVPLVKNLEEQLEPLFHRLTNLEMTVTKMQTEMRENFTKVNFSLEHEIRPMLQLLAENYMPAAIRYTQSLEELIAMKEEIEMLKKVVSEHSELLQLIS